MPTNKKKPIKVNNATEPIESDVSTKIIRGALNKILPTNASQLAASLVTGDSKYGVKDASYDQQKALFNSLENARKRTNQNTGGTEYIDYGKEFNTDLQNLKGHPLSVIAGSALSNDFNAATTFGRVSYEYDPKTETYKVYDSYDYSKTPNVGTAYSSFRNAVGDAAETRGIAASQQKAKYIGNINKKDYTEPSIGRRIISNVQAVTNPSIPYKNAKQLTSGLEKELDEAGTQVKAGYNYATKEMNNAANTASKYYNKAAKVGTSYYNQAVNTANDYYNEAKNYLGFRNGGWLDSLDNNKFKNGGKIKTYTNKLEFDKANKAYSDSLNLFNRGEEKLKYWRNNSSATNSELNLMEDRIDRNFPVSSSSSSFGSNMINAIGMQPIGSGLSLRNVPLYKKPVQPVIFQKLEPIKPLGIKPMETSVEAKLAGNIAVPAMSNTKGVTQNYTGSKALQIQGKPSGYTNEGDNTGRQEFRKGGWLDGLDNSKFQEGGEFGDYKQAGPVEDSQSEYVGRAGMTGMMKSKIATEANYGNPSALRMVSPNPKTGMTPEGVGTHYMTSVDNYAVPELQDKGGKNLELIKNPPISNEDIRFNSPEEADYFAKNYKDVAPMMRGTAPDVTNATEYIKNWYNSPMYGNILRNQIADAGIKSPKRTERIVKRFSKNFNQDLNNSFYNVTPSVVRNPEEYGTGYIDNKGKKQINLDKNFVEGNPKLVNSLFAHELAHDNLITYKDKEYVNKNTPEYNPAIHDEIIYNKLTDPGEVRSQIHSIRQLSGENKIYDPLTQPFKKEYLDKVNESYNQGTKDSENYNQLKRLRKYYSDDQITEMMNTISKSNSNDGKVYAKNGGLLDGLPKNKFYAGGITNGLDTDNNTTPSNATSAMKALMPAIQKSNAQAANTNFNANLNYKTEPTAVSTTFVNNNVAQQKAAELAKDIKTYGTPEKAIIAKVAAKAMAEAKKDKNKGTIAKTQSINPNDRWMLGAANYRGDNPEQVINANKQAQAIGAMGAGVVGVGSIPVVSQTLGAGFAAKGIHDIPQTVRTVMDPNVSLHDKAKAVTFNLADGLGLSEGIKGAKALGKFATEETALKNAWKLNPNRFKPNVTSAHRMMGDEKGLASALESKYLKPSTTGSDIGKIHTNTHYTIGAPSDGREYFGRTWNREFPGPYMAEIPNAASDIRFSQGLNGKKMGSDVFTYPENYIPTSEANIYKKHWWKGYKQVVPKPTTASSATESVISNSAKPIESQAAKPWQMEELPGLHIKSTMSGSPLEKQLSKTGEINIANLKAHIGKAEVGKQDKFIIDKVLNEKFAGKTKIDYNEFRKAVSEESVNLERSVLIDGNTNVGVGRLGYPSARKASYEAAMKESERQIESYTKSINDNPRANEKDLYILKNDLEALLAAQKQLEKNKKEFSNLPLENNTITYGNASEFGEGASHDGGNHPEHTLIHARTLVSPEEPSIMHILEDQSDYWQKSSNKIENLNPEMDYEHLLNKQKKLLEDEKLLNEFKYHYENNIEKNGYKVHKSQVDQLEEKYLRDKTDIELKLNNFKNQEQKQFLGKNYQERLLQENVKYAAEQGKSKMRYPTSETAAKIQGYRKQLIDDNSLLSTEEADELKVLVEEYKKMPDQISDSQWDNIYEPKFRRIEELNKKRTKESDYSPKHQTILKKYSEFGSEGGKKGMIEKLFGKPPEIVTDSNGNTWYEFDIPEKFKKGKAEIKALTTVGAVLGAGALTKDKKQNGGWLENLK